MGFLDIFKRNKKTKQKALPSAEKNEPKVEEKEVKPFEFDIYPEEGQYVIKVQWKGNEFEIGRFTEGILPHLRDFHKRLENILFKLEEGKNHDQLEKARNKVVRLLEQEAAKHQGFTFFTEFIDQYKPEDYWDLEELDQLPEPEREKKVNTIKGNLRAAQTADDVESVEVQCLSHIYRIDESPKDAVITAIQESIAHGKPLDEETVKEIAKYMEIKFKNEDGALYPVYLKIEEKRIWNKLEQTLVAFFIEHPGFEKEALAVENVTRQLDQFKIPTITNNPQGIQFMINQIIEQNVLKYLQEIRSKDFELRKIINCLPTDLPHKETMLEFLDARITSAGQVAYKSTIKERDRDTKSLRDFIEETDFKDDNKENRNDFILFVSKILEKYIDEKYDDTKNNEKEDFFNRLRVGTPDRKVAPNKAGPREMGKGREM